MYRRDKPQVARTWRLIGIWCVFCIGLASWRPGAPAAAGETQYDHLIAAIAPRYGLEPALVKALIRCESAFDALAVSPRGAQGLMQLMPATQVLLGVRDAFDPWENVTGGIRYLAMLQKTFSRDVTLMLAAYNAGPQAVINAGYTIPPFAETERYVQCVLTAWQRYRRFGLPAPSASEQSQQVRTDGGVVVGPLHISHEVVRVGQRVTVRFEAYHTAAAGHHGVVMLTYPETLVSFVALRTSEEHTTVRLPAALDGQLAKAAWVTTPYQFLRDTWSAWKPGERRTARFDLIPGHSQDLALHLSVVVYNDTETAVYQRWSTVVRLPVRPQT